MPQIGLNYSWNLHESTLLYGELFSRGLIKNAWAAQQGITNYSKLTSNLTLSSSLAWLQTGTGFYGTHYAQNFTHQNLPLGTLLGNGAQEFLLTARIEYRRFFMDYLFHLSTMKNGIQPLLLQTYIRPEQIIQHRIDLGFMASNIMQLELFLGITLRQAVGFKECKAISFGLRTAIFKPNNVY